MPDLDDITPHSRKAQMAGAEKRPGYTRWRPKKPIGRDKKKPRARRRGTPPPPSFNFSALDDDQFLTMYETAAVVRRSVACLDNWHRNLPDHPLKGQMLAGRVVYTVGSIRKFIREETSR